MGYFSVPDNWSIKFATGSNAGLATNKITKTDNFTCDGCHAVVQLRDYPNGTYDYYSCYRTGTAHNRINSIGPRIDGFVPTELYFCRTCSIKIEGMIKELGPQ